MESLRTLEDLPRGKGLRRWGKHRDLQTPRRWQKANIPLLNSFSIADGTVDQLLDVEVDNEVTKAAEEYRLDCDEEPTAALVHFYQIDNDAEQPLLTVNYQDEAEGACLSESDKELHVDEAEGACLSESDKELHVTVKPIGHIPSASSSSTTFDSLSDCSSECVDASEASIWGECFVTRIQTWYRGRAARREKRVSVSGEAAARMEEEQSLESDMDQFTRDGLPEAFQERVRTRAYFLYLNGCHDEKKNYYDALKTELDLAYADSQSSNLNFSPRETTLGT